MVQAHEMSLQTLKVTKEVEIIWWDICVIISLLRLNELKCETYWIDKEEKHS